MKASDFKAAWHRVLREPRLASSSSPVLPANIAELVEFAASHCHGPGKPAVASSSPLPSPTSTMESSKCTAAPPQVLRGPHLASSSPIILPANIAELIEFAASHHHGPREPAVTFITFSVSAIRTGLESLPQEIYDHIYTRVFTAPPGDRIVTRTKTSTPLGPLPQYDIRLGTTRSPAEVENYSKEHSLPPSATRKAMKLLQVSRSTRALYAQSFYGAGSKFVLDEDDDDFDKHDHHSVIPPKRSWFMDWLDMLPLAHRILIPEIKVRFYVSGRPGNWRLAKAAGMMKYSADQRDKGTLSASWSVAYVQEGQESVYSREK